MRRRRSRVGRVSTATNTQGDTYAVWAAPKPPVPRDSSTQQPVLGRLATDIYFSFRAAGGSWGPPVKINHDPGLSHSSPAIATDGAGNAYAIWTASNKPGYDADIYFAYRPSPRGGN